MFDHDATDPRAAARPPAIPDAIGRPPAGADAGSEIWLLGQPSLQDFLDYVRKAVAGGADLPQGPLVDAWRAANDVYADLEADEAGLADTIACRPLPRAMQAQARALAQTDAYRRAFDRLPTEIAMVELDKIVVSQRRVTRRFVEGLAARIPAQPDPRTLFDFCHPAERGDPPVRVRRLSGQRFLFSSDSNDLRFHEATLLRPEQIRDHIAHGPINAILGLVVGYGSNFLSAIRSDDRLVLHNGYHRAVALRMAGVTHAPVIIQHVSRRDELDMAAASAVADDPAFYFRAARPPLLKDFFDPRIRTILHTRRAERFVEVTYEVKDYTVYDE